MQVQGPSHKSVRLQRRTRNLSREPKTFYADQQKDFIAGVKCEQLTDVYEYVTCNGHDFILGCGYNGNVFLVRHRESKKEYALKTIRKGDLRFAKREVSIHYILSHCPDCGQECTRNGQACPRISKFHDVYYNNDSKDPNNVPRYHILFERYECNLFTYVITYYPHGFKEPEVANIIMLISKAIKYLHDKGFAHRDIKPQNVLCAPDFDPSNPNGKLYLADLGFTKEECDIDGRRILRSVVGTISFMAPELLVMLDQTPTIPDSPLPDGPSPLIRRQSYTDFDSHPYTKAVDIWSLGVTACQLIRGSVTNNWQCPFDPESFNGDEMQRRRAICRNVLETEYSFEDSSSLISEGACELLRGMLETSPEKRLTIDEVCSQKWLCESVNRLEPYDSNSPKPYITRKPLKSTLSQYEAQDRFQTAPVTNFNFSSVLSKSITELDINANELHNHLTKRVSHIDEYCDSPYEDEEARRTPPAEQLPVSPTE